MISPQILQEKLANLPGADAQSLMAPGGRTTYEEYARKPLFNPRKSAVLIALYPQATDWYFPLIKRPDYEGVHSGQISFPGGKVEEEDTDYESTALREAYEETGILPESVTIIGRLSPLYIPPSNFLVIPVVGTLQSTPKFTKDDREVESILETPLEWLWEPNRMKEGKFKTQGNFMLQAPYFDLHGYKVWGATAMMLAELMTITRT